MPDRKTDGKMCTWGNDWGVERNMNMTVWTNQPLEALEELERTGAFRCIPEKSMNLTKPDSLRKPYAWLAEKMLQRIGSRPQGVSTPIWAWHTWNFEHRCPDPESAAFLKRTSERVLLTLDIPEAEMVLTDFEAWQTVMQGSYVSGAMTEEEAVREEMWLENLDEPALDAAIRDSWDRVFEISRVETPVLVRGRFIQATFWEIRKEYIRDIRILEKNTENGA